MQEPKREPQTEEEAQDLKRFLEEGAETAVETTRTFRPADVPDALQDVGLIRFEVTGEELVAELAGEDDQLVLDVEIAGVRSSEDPPLLVFTGARDADAAGRVEGDPGFVGALAFFVGSGDGSHEMTFRFRLNITAAVLSDPAPGPFAMSLVPAPPAETRSDNALTLSSAEIQLVRSVVEA